MAENIGPKKKKAGYSPGRGSVNNSSLPEVPFRGFGDDKKKGTRNIDFVNEIKNTSRLTGKILPPQTPEGAFTFVQS